MKKSVILLLPIVWLQILPNNIYAKIIYSIDLVNAGTGMPGALARESICDLGIIDTNSRFGIGLTAEIIYWALNRRMTITYKNNIVSSPAQVYVGLPLTIYYYLPYNKNVRMTNIEDINNGNIKNGKVIPAYIYLQFGGYSFSDYDYGGKTFDLGIAMEFTNYITIKTGYLLFSQTEHTMYGGLDYEKTEYSAVDWKELYLLVQFHLGIGWEIHK